MTLSESKKKIILWSVLLILAGTLFFFYAKSVSQKIKNFKTEDLKQQLKIPELKEELNKLRNGY